MLDFIEKCHLADLLNFP